MEHNVQDDSRNARLGIFVFSLQSIMEMAARVAIVAMPAWAFLFSHISLSYPYVRGVLERSQCPLGHFCFLTIDE